MDREYTTRPNDQVRFEWNARMITVAITGGTGFIGRVLADAHLQRGDRVRVLTRRPGAHPEGTVAFEGDLAANVPKAFTDGADIVYHLAAELEDRSRMRAVNVLGTAMLLDTAMGRCGRWVQLSSVGVYGPPEGGSNITESTKPRPASPYERSKLDCDLAVEHACTLSGCAWGILRPSNVVGAAMKNQSAFNLVRSVLSGRFVYVGSRNSIATYVHVEDVVRALIAMSSALSGSIINLSSDCTWVELVEGVCMRACRKPPSVRLPEWLARGTAVTLGRLPGFPLTPSRVNALVRRGGYPSVAELQLEGFRFIRPMPAGFDEITDHVKACL